MKELYYLTRLDSLNNFLQVFAVIFTLLTIAGFIGFLTCRLDGHFEPGDRYYKFWTRSFWTVVPLMILLWLGYIFVPTTKEAYMIYGIGGSIDFLKSDTTAVKLPHKVIEAIDGWMDFITVDNNNNSNNNNNGRQENKEFKY